MSFKGTNAKITSESMSKGIDGITAISDIPEGYALEMENVDLSQPGVVKKRAGYNVWGCQLPVKTRSVTHNSDKTMRCVFAALPVVSCTLSCYLDTAIAGSPSSTVDAYYKRVDNREDTIFVEVSTCGQTITMDTIIEIVDTTATRRYVQPLMVFSDGTVSGNAKILLPFYAKEWFTGTLSDTAIIVNAKICTGFAHPRIKESDVLSLSLTTKSPSTLRVAFADTSLVPSMPDGTIVMFETCLGADTPIVGYATARSNEYIDFVIEDIPLPVGTIDTHYFSMRYATGKSFWYKSKDNSFMNMGSIHPSSTEFLVKLSGPCEMTFDDSLVNNVQLKNSVSVSATTAVTGKIGAYFASWQAEVGTENYQVADIPWEKLSYVYYAFAWPNTTGSALIYAEPTLFAAHYAALISQRAARNPACKILLSIGGAGNCDNIKTVSNSATLRAAFIATLVAEVKAKGIDGIDMDWEGGDRIPSSSLLFAELRAALNTAGKYSLTAAISMDLRYGPVEVKSVHPYLDLINIMAYDIGYPQRVTPDITMPNAPLGNIGSDYDNTGLYGIKWYIENQWKKSNIPLAKCSLGMPLYSYSWTSVTATDNGFMQHGTGVVGQPLYKDVIALLSSGYTRYYDAFSESYWLFDGSTFYSLDDVTTCETKTDYLKAEGFAGMFVWELAGDLPVADPLSIIKKASEELNATGTVVTSEVSEPGFMYGTDISVGYIGLLNKYFDVDTQTDRVLCGYDGSVFVEDSHLTIQPRTISGMKYSSSVSSIAANRVLDTFEIPLADANTVYKVGDVVTTTYAADTAGTLVINDWDVTAVSVTSLTVSAQGQSFLFLPKDVVIALTRTSDRVYLASSIQPITLGMTIQYGERNNLNPWYVIKEVDFKNSESGFFIVLDREITWKSDQYLTILPVFLPVYPSGIGIKPIDYSTYPQGYRDFSSVTLERDVIIACGKSGMWRFNGEQLLNMRIPAPPPGIVRSVIGSGGQLAVDTGVDGIKYGRFYQFYVTYSYVELVNGKLVRFESALNTLGSYQILSEAAIDGSSTSQLVELQVPTIPNGIGLPAADMKINIYRTLYGTASSTVADSGIFLREVEAPNRPELSFISILAGVAPKLIFNERQYGLLWQAIGGDKATDETQRRIVDVPLASLLTTIENRIVAANGEDQPYVNIICNSVFDASGAFAAHGSFNLVPPSSTEKSYNFITCPVDFSTITAANGAGSLPFKVWSVSAPKVVSVTYTDNSHLMTLTGATTINGTQYLLRFAGGRSEAKRAGTDTTPYYDGYGIEDQVYTATNSGGILSSPKKWTAVKANGSVKVPSTVSTAEDYLAAYLFEEVFSVGAGTSINGLFIDGNTGVGEKQSSGVKVKIRVPTGTTDLTGTTIILRGAGTAGLIQNASKAILNWDTQIVAVVGSKVTASTYFEYPLTLQVKGETGTDFKDAAIAYAVSVRNETTVTSPAFTIFKKLSTARTFDAITITPTTATIVTSSAVSASKDDYVSIDGLPDPITSASGMSFNGNFKVVSQSGTTIVLTVTPPQTMRGTFTETFGSPYKGTICKVSTVLSLTTDSAGKRAVEVAVTSLATSVTIKKGTWAYMIVAGKESDNFSLALSGWFQVSEVYVGSAWVTAAASGSAITKFRLLYPETYDYSATGVATLVAAPIDFSAVTGVSETRIIVAGTVANTEYIPVPVPTKRGILNDITGTMFGPVDGYTILEKVVKRLTLAINHVLHDSHFAYWGKFNATQADESQHPPVNGLKIVPHLYPDDKYRYQYSTATISSSDNESWWEITGAPTYWRVEGASRFNVTATAQQAKTTKKYRPARVWWTNPLSDGLGQAFREYSTADISSQDGEELIGCVPHQTFSIFAKKSSMWRGSFDASTQLTFQRVPATVGASSAKNLVPTERGVFFLHDSGVYLTDGSTVEPVLQVSRYFNGRAVQNLNLFSYTSGHHNPLTKTVYVGVSLSDTEDELATDVSAQFVFNYSLRTITVDSINTGWSVNTNVPATAWVRVQSDDYFASSKGKVYRLRTEKGASKYNDETSGVPMKIVTRFIDSQDPVMLKFYRSIFFQLGKDTSSSFAISLSWDFAKEYTLVTTFNVDKQTFGTAPFGTSYWGCDRYLETVRKTPTNLRVAQMSIKIEDDSVDSSAEVYGIFLDSTPVSALLHKQPNGATV